MSMRETVISAALVNTGLLFTLFVTAVSHEGNSLEGSPRSTSSSGRLAHDLHSNVGSDFEQAQITHSSHTPKLPIQHRLSDGSQVFHENSPKDIFSLCTAEHKVTRGQRLEDVARIYGMSVEELVLVNELASTQLYIDQKLRVKPLATESPKSHSLGQLSTGSAASAKEQSPVEDLRRGNRKEKSELSSSRSHSDLDKSGHTSESGSSSSSSSSQSKYHFVEKGESPWHIAKKYQMSLQRLLDLNDLDETSARKLRAGDRLRVR